MKKVKQLNNWTIKEKREDEVPQHLDLEQRFVVFSPNGTCMEDNLTLEQAINFAESNLDYVVRKDKKQS